MERSPVDDVLPAPLLMDTLDASIVDYTDFWAETVGYYFCDGRVILNVRLGRCPDVTGEAITIGCLGRSMGATQTVWVMSARDDSDLVGAPFLVMTYGDRWGNEAMRVRRLRIGDAGRVSAVGEWEDRDTSQSKMALALRVPWTIEPGHVPSIMQLVRARGHSILT